MLTLHLTAVQTYSATVLIVGFTLILAYLAYRIGRSKPITEEFTDG